MAKVEHLDEGKLFEVAVREVRGLKRMRRERNRTEKREYIPLLNDLQPFLLKKKRKKKHTCIYIYTFTFSICIYKYIFSLSEMAFHLLVPFVKYIHISIIFLIRFIHSFGLIH